MAKRWNKTVEWVRRSGLIGMALVLVGVLSVRSAIADWNDVPTGSMKPTILVGDRIFVNKLAYDLRFPFTGWRLATWDNPERGHIVTCWSPQNGDRLVKRVVGGARRHSEHGGGPPGHQRPFPGLPGHRPGQHAARHG